MKTKHILLAMALPALFAACADEDFVSQGGPSFENNGEFVSLPEGWAVGVSRGTNASTKVAWDLQAWGGALRYSWLPALDNAGTGILPEHIGFAWRGDAPDSQVRTNYKFTLGGYLKKGQETPKFKECDGELIVTNGYLFGGYASDALQLQVYDESMSKTEMQAKSDYTLNWASNAWTLKNTTGNLDMYDTQNLPDGAPDVRTGIFTTDNSTVFSGDYIVYFPFNEEFAETGNLPAISPASFTQDMDNKNLAAHLNGKTFAYGTTKIEKGGTMAEGFGTQNLSSIIAFNLVNETEAERWISKVILYDEGSENGFYTKVGLDATKIGTATGKDLYVVNENTEYSPTLLVNLEGTVQGQKKDYMALAASGDGKSKIVTLAALPTTLVKPVVYIMFADGLSVKKELAVKPLNPGEVTGYTVTLTKADLEKKVAVVVNTKSFLQAWEKAWDSTEKSYTIETLGDITFDKTIAKVSNDGGTASASFDLEKQANGMLFNKNLTIEGDGKLILPADLTWLVKAKATKDAYPTLTINNPIVIENEGCCGNAPARLMLRNKDKNYGAYVLGNTIENNGEMYIGTDNGVGVYTFKGNINNNYDADLEKAGVINFGGKNLSTVTVEKTIKNAGIINTVPYVYAADGTSHETAGGKQSVVVNLNNIDNVGEKSQLNIGKQTIVYMNGAANNEGKITIATNNGTTQQLDGTLEINGALKNENEIEVFGVMRRIEGSFANTADDAKLIDHAGAQVTGGSYDIAKGDYICDVDNALTTDGDRLGYALNENRGVTIVRFVDSDETDDAKVSYKYDLYKYLNGSNYSMTGKNFVVATTGKNKVKLSCTNPGDAKNPAAPAAATIDGYLEVNNEAELSGIMLTVKGDVKINVAENGSDVGMLTVNKVNSKSAAIEAQTALTVEGNLNVNAGNSQKNLIPNYTVAQFARTCVGSAAKAGNLKIAANAVASFQSSTYSDIHGDIVNAGEFILDLTSGTATGVPGEVWCNSFSKVGNGKWTNGSPSTY